MIKLTIEGKTVTVYPGGDNNSPIVYLNTYANNGEDIYKALQDCKCVDFTLVTISGLDWAHDMSPWTIPPVFENGTPYTGGADDYLHLLTEKIVPKVESNLHGTVLWRGLAGYSLAGLFALYTAYQTDLFSHFASISGSLWFPDFKQYVFSHEMRTKPECLYISLGDKECKTRNLYLKTVQSITEEVAEFYQKKGINMFFCLNPGNHFKNEVKRIVSGISWILEN